MSRDWTFYLKYILAECQNIRKFTANITFEEIVEEIAKKYLDTK